MLEGLHGWRAQGNTLFVGLHDSGDGGKGLMAAAEAVNSLAICEPLDGPRFLLCDPHSK